MRTIRRSVCASMFLLLVTAIVGYNQQVHGQPQPNPMVLNAYCNQSIALLCPCQNKQIPLDDGTILTGCIAYEGNEQYPCSDKSGSTCKEVWGRCTSLFHHSVYSPPTGYYGIANCKKGFIDPNVLVPPLDFVTCTK